MAQEEALRALSLTRGLTHEEAMRDLWKQVRHCPYEYTYCADFELRSFTHHVMTTVLNPHRRFPSSDPCFEQSLVFKPQARARSEAAEGRAATVMAAAKAAAAPGVDAVSARVLQAKVPPAKVAPAKVALAQAQVAPSRTLTKAAPAEKVGSNLGHRRVKR